jgi:TM2 domain-containing membrane protein YozV
MDCVNHTGVEAKAFCQNCGKALCATCVRNLPGGQVLCEPCYVSWQGLQQPFMAPQPGAPNPILAAVLGVIPGVGAMYNGQIIKGLIHVVIFAVLVNMADHFGIFGLFITAWVLYQVFDAYHTASARRDGLPLPDPLGLNEAASWFNLGQRPPMPPAPGAAPQPGAPYGTAPGAPQASYTPPQAGPYAAGFTPVAGYGDPTVPPIPPIPPVPPVYWKRKEPIGAIVLIGLGIILLLNQMGFVTERLWGFMWPLMFIVLGAWLIVRRMGDTTKGGKQ